MIITIDGPTGTGKSTIAREIAKKLRFFHLDSGALYRTLAWFFLEKEVPLDDEERLKEALKSFSLSVKEGRYLIDGVDVTDWIRSEEISSAASKISKWEWVRGALLPLQKKLSREGNIVAEGRDMGTVVFPDAELKIYLTAKPEIRAERRRKELDKATYEEVLKELEKRDHQDSTRKISPLKPAEKAVVIDTSFLSIDEVIEEILKHYRKIAAK